MSFLTSQDRVLEECYRLINDEYKNANIKELVEDDVIANLESIAIWATDHRGASESVIFNLLVDYFEGKYGFKFKDY